MSHDACVIAVAPSHADLQRIAEFLLPEGIEVRAAGCLQEAICLAVAPAPVILYDTDAPQHWRQALEQFFLRWPGSCVVLVSRLADQRMWIEALEAGAYDLLMKPFRPVEICAVVRGALLRVEAPGRTSKTA